MNYYTIMTGPVDAVGETIMFEAPVDRVRAEACFAEECAKMTAAGHAELDAPETNIQRDHAALAGLLRMASFSGGAYVVMLELGDDVIRPPRYDGDAIVSVLRRAE